MFGLSNRSDYWISNKNLYFLVKLLIQKFCRYIFIHTSINNDRNLRMFDYTPGLGASGNRITSSPPKGTGPLTHNIMVHKN
jgi:hypothetical protein